MLALDGSAPKAFGEVVEGKHECLRLCLEIGAGREVLRWIDGQFGAAVCAARRWPVPYNGANVAGDDCRLVCGRNIGGSAPRGAQFENQEEPSVY